MHLCRYVWLTLLKVKIFDKDGTLFIYLFAGNNGAPGVYVVSQNPVNLGPVRKAEVVLPKKTVLILATLQFLASVLAIILQVNKDLLKPKQYTVRITIAVITKIAAVMNKLNHSDLVSNSSFTTLMFTDITTSRP